MRGVLLLGGILLLLGRILLLLLLWGVLLLLRIMRLLFHADGLIVRSSRGIPLDSCLFTMSQPSPPCSPGEKRTVATCIAAPRLDELIDVVSERDAEREPDEGAEYGGGAGAIQAAAQLRTVAHARVTRDQGSKRGKASKPGRVCVSMGAGCRGGERVDMHQRTQVSASIPSAAHELWIAGKKYGAPTR